MMVPAKKRAARSVSIPVWNLSEPCVGLCGARLCVDRKLEDGEQSRAIVSQLELALVQVRDRFGEGEAKARSLVGPAGIEPPESPARLVSPFGWDSGAAVADLHPDLP